MKTFKAILHQEYLINKRSLSNLIMGRDASCVFSVIY